VTEQQQPAGQAPPGWYPDPTGQMRWWDGQQWGQVAQSPAAPASMDPKTMAMLAQLLGIFSFLGPLIIYLINGEKDPFVRHHAAEALNFQITLLIGYLTSFVLMLVLIGFLTFFVVWIGGLVLMIMATIAANRGEWYRYPINIRLVPGAIAT
jgi:uncharacterized Tic20 family protein